MYNFITDTFVNFIDSEFTEKEELTLLNPVVYDTDDFESDKLPLDVVETEDMIDKDCFISGLKRLRNKLISNSEYPFRKDIYYYSAPIDESIKYIIDNKEHRIVWFMEYVY